ncbi:MAG: DNA polymerase III subunit gamma/tau [Spirulinaceae cyanobacterium]
MYNPLHHKYRPQTFAELVGQEAISTTLTNAILTQKIAPAYLFTGPRGTGKTSSARIFAKSLNCIASQKPTPNPCGKCEVCRQIADGLALDVIEIDAASNTGVDNIRDIIERSQFAPVRCRYKIYIIDEVHMLSTAAFNALLKTLEEPPGRVLFVLATTDPQRVLSTIISRCQRFDFRRIALEAMVSHLEKIAIEENININLEAITIVGQIANGGLRDAESLLDQLSLLTGEITVEKVWDLVGAVPERDLFDLLQAINSDQPETVIKQCRNLLNRGREPLVVLQNLAGFYLNLLIAKTSPHSSEMVAVTALTWQALCTEAQHWHIQRILQGQQHLKDSEVQIKNTTQPRLWLEVTLLSLLPSAMATPTNTNNQQLINNRPATTNTQQTNTNKPLPNQQTSTPQATTNTQQTNTNKQTPPPQPVSNNKPQTPQPAPEKPGSIPQITSQATTNDSADLLEIWHKIIECLVPTTQSLLKDHCNLISLTASSAIITAKNQTLLDIAKGRKDGIEKAFKKLYNQQVTVRFQIGNKVTPQGRENFSQTPPKAVEKPPQQPLSNPNLTREIDNLAQTALPTKEEVKKAPPQEPSPLEITTPTVVKEETPISNVPSSEIKSATSTIIREETLVTENIPNSYLTNLPETNTEMTRKEIANTAKSLAEIFSGEVIELGDELTFEEKELPQPSFDHDLEDEYADF